MPIITPKIASLLDWEGAQELSAEMQAMMGMGPEGGGSPAGPTAPPEGSPREMME